MNFRAATERDIERLIELHLGAYPDDVSVAFRERNLTKNRLGGLEHLRVLEEDGVILAQAFLFPLRSAWGGRSVKLGGIASVAVASDQRGRGLATALMGHLHALSDARGEALTMLYAYRYGFYSRLGYAMTPSRKRLAIDPRSIPDAWRELARGRVRSARGTDRASLKAAYARSVSRGSGRLVRTERAWDQLFAWERLQIFVVRGRGYVTFTLEREHQHAETVVEVQELVAEDGETRRALLGALGGLRDQVSEIIVEVGEHDPLERALVDPDARRAGSQSVEHGFGEIVGGPMIRLEDIPRAIEARAYPWNGAFDVVVRGEDLAFRVRVEGGRAKVGPARGGGALETSRAGLAALFYGGLVLGDAVALGIADVDARIADRVGAIVRIEPIGPIDTF